MSYKRNQILSLLYRIFQAEDYRWGLERAVPTHTEIDEAVTNLEESAFGVKGTAESGRIRVVYDKVGKTYSYYLSLGED